LIKLDAARQLSLQISNKRLRASDKPIAGFFTAYLDSLTAAATHLTIAIAIWIGKLARPTEMRILICARTFRGMGAPDSAASMNSPMREPSEPLHTSSV
jgi:hypothetical protein